MSELDLYIQKGRNKYKTWLDEWYDTSAINAHIHEADDSKVKDMVQKQSKKRKK